MFKNLVFVVFILIFTIDSAYARIDILPRKVVLESRDRSAEITILNLFNEPSLYRLSFLSYRQNSDGTYTTLDTPLSPDFNPDEVIRISPRQFQVASNGRQKIRLSIRKPENLPEGEYRFHVLATRYEIPNPDQQANDEGVSINMKMNVGVSIPVVVRHGQLSVDAKIAQTQFMPAQSSADNRPHLNITVNRSGTASAIGKISIYANSAGEEKRIGHISNFNIFSESNSRTTSIPLSMNPQGLGQIRIVYTADDGKIFDEKSLSF